jgi:hypothetical protein
LAKILEFTGTPATQEQIKDAVDFAAYENLKKMEAGKSTFSFWRAGWRHKRCCLPEFSHIGFAFGQLLEA